MDLRSKKFHLIRNGIKLTASISPCVFMHKNYPLQIQVEGPRVKEGYLGWVMLRDKTKNGETATEDDVKALLKTVKLVECSNDGCSNLAFDKSGDKYDNREGQCETCFVAKLNAEMEQAQEAELKAVARRDKQQYKKGMRYRVTAWIHGHGDDQQVDIYFNVKPTKAMIRKETGSTIDDWQTIKLTA
jgi:hypothetical protein